MRNNTFTHKLCSMKNLTLAIEESTLREARRIAAERSTTLNAMIRDYLDQLTTRESQATQARARIRELSEQSTARIGKRAWSRQDIHER